MVLFTIVCRWKLGTIIPFTVLNESEHINYFTQQSLSQLLMNNGFEPIEISCSNYGWSLWDKVLLCLAKKINLSSKIQ
jgi:hypothetical protein